MVSGTTDWRKLTQQDANEIELLTSLVGRDEWQIPSVRPSARALFFLSAFSAVLREPHLAAGSRVKPGSKPR